MHETIKMIQNHRKNLTAQQYRTLKGQCLAGDVEGAKKGLKKLLNRSC